MRLELLEENVGRNLKETVWHEENDEGIVVQSAVGVFGVDQMEILSEVENLGVGNVDAICSIQSAHAIEVSRAHNTYPGRPRGT